MSPARSLLASTAISLSLMATAAFADLSAADVWVDWRGYLEGMGYTVTATETGSGGTLSVSDIAVQINGGPDVDQMTMRLGTLQFVEINDGSVEVVMPATMPIVFEVTPKSTQEPARIELSYTQSDQKMTVSGNADEMVYDYAVPSFGLALTSLLVDGTTMGPDNARLSMTGKDLKSITTVSAGETRSYDQSMNIGNIAYDAFFKDPTDVESISIGTTVESIAFTGTSAVPVGQITEAQELTPLLAAGFAFDGTFASRGTETKVEIVSEEGPTRIKTGSAAATLAVAMGADGIRYDVAADQVQMGAEIAGLPFPLFAEMEKSGFSMVAPILKSDVPQDFKLAFNATQFTMSDIIWALFDPAGQLPRDPATIALDMSGKAKVLVDSLAPKAMEGLAENGTTPAEVHALRIDRLTVDAVGAKLDATGDVTFDNDDTTTFPGFPKPVGDININLSGANGLLDKLVAMGMLPAEQVMGARMMMGVFAVPGDAPDTLKSNIEFNDAGQILANGQRIK